MTSRVYSGEFNARYGDRNGLRRLVSGACFADLGHMVICIDEDSSKIERLEKGEMPIFGRDCLEQPERIR